jgi:hypothetical protein
MLACQRSTMLTHPFPHNNNLSCYIGFSGSDTSTRTSRADRTCRIDRQVTEGGSGGCGYSLTCTGRAWLADPDTVLLPTDPSEMGELLAKHRSQQGAEDRALTVVGVTSRKGFFGTLRLGIRNPCFPRAAAVQSTKSADRLFLRSDHGAVGPVIGD